MGQPLLKTQMTQATSLFPTTAPSELLVAGPEAPARAGFERFLQDGYEEAFGANLRDHFPLIAGLIDDRGQVSAAAGVRFAENEPLFLECYLDGPVEGALAPIHGGSPRRSEIVEVGSLVSRSPLCALNLFAALAHWAAVDCGRRFAVATVTPRLESLLRRAGFQMSKIADADPARVPCAARDWGAYYQGGPAVMTGRIDMPSPLADLQQIRTARAAARLSR